LSALQVISRKLFGLIILLLAAGPVSVTVAAQTYFYDQSSLPAGTQPTSVVLADFNADGKLDIAVTNEMDNTVSVMLSKPDGSIAPKVDYGVGTAPVAVVSGDFNGDKIPDLAVINSQDNTVSVLLGTTNGTFQSQVTYATGKTPVAILTLDLNGDQKIDLAVANQGDGTVSTLIGNGDGTFQALTATATVSAPLALGSGDFNGDGKPDLVAVNGQGDLSLLLSNQNGGFTSSTQSIGLAGSGLTVSDFNGDGNSDIAVGNPNTDNLVILIGNGKGGFTTLYQGLAGPPSAVSSGDINGDGKADLAVTTGGSTYPSSIAILLGNGDGTFRQALYDGFPGHAPPVAIGDMNNDGYLDLVLPDTVDNVVTIELGNGSGLFTSRADSSLPTSGGVLTGAVDDFNGDGKPDVVLVQINQNSQGVTGFLSVLAGNGDGTFKPAVESPVPNIGIGDLVLGDFNGDGKVDAASAFIPTTGGITVVLGNGDGTFGPSIANPVNIPGLSTQAMIGGDFNHDGKTDLAILSLAQGNTLSPLYVLLSNGDGTFQPKLVDNVSGITMFLAAGDFNHDGNLDIAVSSGSGIGTSVLVYLGHGDGTFARASSMSPGTASAYSLKAADFNGDGKTDLVVATGQGFVFFAGNGDGAFQSPIRTPTPNAVTQFQLGDFNGDGKLDLAVLGLAPNVSISLGNGDGTFQALLPFQAPYYPRTYTVGDFNADGSTDLMVASTANSWTPTPSQVASVWLSTPTISLPASPILFGPQVVGTSSSPTTIPLTDLGNAPLSLSAVTTSGDFSATNTCPASLAIGQECSLDVAFTPSASGTDKGSLRLSDNVAPGTQVLGLIGTGLTPPLPAAALSPSSLTFSPQPTGSTSTTQMVTLTNSGQALLDITSIAVSGDFAQTNTCGSSLAAGANCAIAVTFKPTATGNRSSSLTVTDNTGASPQSVALVGTGSSIDISATSAALTIGSPGGSVTDTIQVSSVQGFTGTVTFTCTVTYKGSGAPTDAPACNINPQQAPISASSPQTVALAVSTTKAAESRSPWLHTGGAFAAVFLMGLVPVRRRKYAVPLVVCGIALGLAVAGCGGGGSGALSTPPSDPGTTAGSYQVVVTAASSTVVASTTISLALE
jgi:FG-GAP-like repeat/Abnormal spindle-like microcephaly-assoc'd, ASPM-SPD-2-Hydin